MEFFCIFAACLLTNYYVINEFQTTTGASCAFFLANTGTSYDSRHQIP